MKYTFLFSLATLLLVACSAPEAKDKINKAGDLAGQTMGEFVSGVTDGVGKAFDVQVQLPTNLAQQGLRFGKITVSSDTAGTDNLLTVYVIFDKDFKGTLLAKAFDDMGLEMGRTKASVRGKSGEASFVEFHFDKRTNLDHDSQITLE